MGSGPKTGPVLLTPHHWLAVTEARAMEQLAVAGSDDQRARTGVSDRHLRLEAIAGAAIAFGGYQAEARSYRVPSASYVRRPGREIE